MTYLGKYSALLGTFFYTMPVSAADPSHKTGATIPHMDTTTFASQLFWLTICFGLLYFLMARVALPQIQDILNRRQSTIQNNLEKAAKLRDEAEDLQIAYDKALRQAENHAQEFLKSSLDDVAEKNALSLSKAMDTVMNKIQKAEEDISKKRDEMAKDAEKIADDIATLLVEKVLKAQQTSSSPSKKRAS